RPCSQPLLERFAVETLHDDERRAVVFADVIQRADVRVIERRNRLGFALEALAEPRVVDALFRKDLDGNRAVQSRVARAIDLAHPAGSERRDDFIRAETNARFEAHRYFASGSGLIWKCTTLLWFCVPPSLWNGARVAQVDHKPLPFPPVLGSSMRPSK